MSYIVSGANMAGAGCFYSPEDELANIQPRSMFKFCGREYWKRTWIVQELQLGRQEYIACGSYRAELSDLQYPASSLPFHGAAADEEIDNSYLTYEQDLKQPPLRELLIAFGDTHCQDPRDKVYALRNLASDIRSYILAPDYSKDVHTLYWDVLEVCKGNGAKFEFGSGFQYKLLRILNISVESLLEDFVARYDSATSVDFATCQCGWLLHYELTVDKVSPRSSFGTAMVCSTEWHGRWMTFSTVSEGDTLLVIDAYLLCGRFALTTTPDARGEICSASWALRVSSEGVRGPDVTAQFELLKKMDEACHKFALRVVEQRA